MRSTKQAIQKGVADFSFIIGTGMYYGGAAALFTMAVVGTVAVDLVVLSYAKKNNTQFLSGFLCSSFFSRQPNLGNLGNFGIALIVSPITTALAIALSVCLGVPQVGLYLMAGWLTAGLSFAVGKKLLEFSNNLNTGLDSQYQPAFS